MAADDSVYFMRTSWPGTARRRARWPGHPRPPGAGEGGRGCPGAKLRFALPGM